MAVGEKREKVFTITNQSNKSAAVYYINREKLPATIKLSKYSGRIYPGTMEKIGAVFVSGKANYYSFEIEIAFRGGKVLKIPIEAEVIIPSVVLY